MPTYDFINKKTEKSILNLCQYLKRTYLEQNPHIHEKSVDKYNKWYWRVSKMMEALKNYNQR